MGGCMGGRDGGREEAEGLGPGDLVIAERVRRGGGGGGRWQRGIAYVDGEGGRGKERAIETGRVELGGEARDGWMNACMHACMEVEVEVEVRVLYARVRATH
jgi:hypothetical protein